jgi:hypothetical protein
MKAAAFVQSYDEPIHLVRWLDHYVTAVGAENVFVLWSPCEGDRQPFLANVYPQVKWIQDPAEARVFEDFTCRDRLQAFQHQLLADGYDVVIGGDADELLVPTDGSTLAQLLQRFHASDAGYIRARGYNVFQNVEGDDPMHYRWHCPAYNKTLVTKVPLTYRLGMHMAWSIGTGQSWTKRDDPAYAHRVDTTFPDREDLCLDLLHMHYASFDNYVAQDMRRCARLQDANRFVRFPGHNREAAFHFFKTGVLQSVPDHRTFNEMRKHPREPIPDHWKPLVT